MHCNDEKAHSTFSILWNFSGLRFFQISCHPSCILQRAPEIANGDLLYCCLSRLIIQPACSKLHFSFCMPIREMYVEYVYVIMICFWKYIFKIENIRRGEFLRTDRDQPKNSFSLPVLGLLKSHSYQFLADVINIFHPQTGPRNW